MPDVVAARAPKLIKLEFGFAAFQDHMAALNPPTQNTSAAAPPPPPLEEEDQLKKYLDEAAPPPGTNALQWWGDNEWKFPAVAAMARQHLSVPATSASAERIFSLAGRLYGDLTHGLSEVSLEDRMWAKINRHN